MESSPSLSSPSAPMMTNPIRLVPSSKEQPQLQPPSNDKKKNNNKWTVRLEFSNVCDWQTRLVLLPRVEDEGRGAILSSYSHPPQSPEDEEEDGQETAESSKENRDDQESTDTKLTGSILVGMVGHFEDDWSDKDFTSILASIREANAPFTLVFEAPEVSTKVEPKPQEEEEAPKENKDSLQSGMMALSAWGTRMRTQATDVASAAMASAAKERARLSQQQTKNTNTNTLTTRPCDVFLQTSVGAFIPVSTAQSKVTTSSLLLVRKSATEPVSQGFSFQWYRSSSPSSAMSMDDGVSLSSKSRASSSAEGTNDEVEWVALEGATHAAFQPNTTLVGRRLRCIVLVEDNNSNSSDESSLEDLEDVDLESVDAQVLVCDLSEPVTADLTLFNVARQALVRGAHFGGFKGRGNASGRHFRVEVSIGMSKKRKTSTSSLKIYQVSGPESEPLSEAPILQASATADPAKPKHLDLILPVLPETSILSALCTDGVFQLEAPNRVTRESFLLTMGIANYLGKPANLDAKTVLFRDEATTTTMRVLFQDEYLSSVATSSCASSVHSSTKSVSSFPMSPDASSVHSMETTPNNNRVAELEKQLEFMRCKLTRKDKVVSELQRQITRSDSVYQQTKQVLGTTQHELIKTKSDGQDLTQSLKSAQTKIQCHSASVIRMQGEHALHLSTLENRIMTQSEKIADLEKSNRSLQNEKAVLAAAVEARESKLVKMGALQTSFDQLTESVVQQDALRVELEESNKRYQELQRDLDKVTKFEKECRAALEHATQKVKTLTTCIQKDEETNASVYSQLDSLQQKNQQLKGERNNFKQKNDSLSKEISRLCRNGRTIKDIEKTLADHEALRQEVELLRQQKRMALEDAHLYRTSYEQSKVAQKLAGMDYGTHAALERNAELDRLLAEMTEYLNAKEMQLETMRQVNDYLQSEIHSLAKANLNKNEV